MRGKNHNEVYQGKEVGKLLTHADKISYIKMRLLINYVNIKLLHRFLEIKYIWLVSESSKIFYDIRLDKIRSYVSPVLPR